MAYIDELVSTVLKVTGRPDQSSWAFMSLNNCIKELSRSADYPEDLYETEFLADDPDGATLSGPIQIAIPDLDDFLVAPYYDATIRKIAYLNYNNQKLTEVTPHSLLLGDCLEQDIFYRNGNNMLAINPSHSYRSFRIGVYCVPGSRGITPDEDHWLLDAASEILIVGTMAKVYKNTGDDASHDRFYQEYLRMSRQFKLDRVNSGVV